MAHQFVRIILILVLFSCGESGRNSARFSAQELATRPPAPRTDLAKGVIILPQTTLTGNRKYALYLPENAQPERSYPALIFLDPHAEGQLPLQKYRTFADRFGYILIGSLDVKNGMGMDVVTEVVNDLVSEAKLRLPVDQTSITLAGFSGGGKGALAASLNTKGLSSVIYCGAAFPPNSIQLNLPAMGITGTSDMNYAEVIDFATSVDSLNSGNTLIVSHNKHEWPDTSAFLHAFLWSISNRCLQAKTHCDPVGLELAFNELAAASKKEKDLYLKELELKHLIKCGAGNLDTKPTEDELKKLLDSPAFATAMKQLSADMRRETHFRQDLQQAFTDRPMDWWKNTVKQLQQQQRKDPVRSRLLGYISLGAYSYSRRSLDQGDLTSAQRFLQLYRLADYENPEWAFLTACLAAQSGNREAVMENLKLSVRLGLNDPLKIRNEPLLSGFQSDPEMNALIRKLGR